MNSREIVKRIIVREGGSRYTNHPADRGGPTKWGITQAAWAHYKGHEVEPEDIKAITEPEAVAFYIDEYVVNPGFVNVEDPLLRELVVDCGVNHGTHRATQWLQQAVGASPDGIFGPKTLAAVAAASPRAAFTQICAYRVRFYGRIVTRDPSQSVFAAGWANRAAEFLDMLSDTL